LKSADLVLNLTFYALFAWGASILIAAIPTNSKIAYRIKWFVVRGTTIVGAFCAFVGFSAVSNYTSQVWGWSWYLSIPGTMLYIGAMCMIQWHAMKLSGNIWFDEKSPPTSRDTQKSLFSRPPFVKNEYLAGVLLLSGLLVGFFAGREFPRETLLEKECRVWAEKVTRKAILSYPERNQSTTKNPYDAVSTAVPDITYESDPNTFALYLGHCMRGGR
jgi:hypothetical protein